MNRVAHAVLVMALLVFVLAGCTSTGSDGVSASTPSSASPADPRTAREICVDGVHKTPRNNIVVERAVLAPLEQVKAWVLSTSPDSNWSTFSLSLSQAPLSEQVAVCVFSKKDGTYFTLPPAAGSPGSVEAIVEIVRPNGDATGFIFGDTADMLDAVSASFGPTPSPAPS